MVFDPVVDAGAVFSALSAGHRSVLADSTRRTAIWLDTADWRLARAGAALRQETRGNRRELVLSLGGEDVRGPVGRARWPGPVGALPSSPVRKRLRTLIGPRAVLPLAEVEIRDFPLSLLDELDKTRVRGGFAQYRLLSPRRLPLSPRLQLDPLRGYGEDAGRAAAAVSAALPVRSDPPSDALEALLAAGHRVGHFAGQGPVQLDPQSSGGTGLALVLRDYLDVVVANREAAASGLDSESLHDLRVAVRASRAILKNTGDLLPNDLAGRFGPELRWLAGLTTRARDLDVALLAVTGQGELPIDGLDDRGPLRELLARRRAATFRTMGTQLSGERADTLLSEWRAALEHVVETDPPGATVVEVAAVRVRATHQSLVRAFSRTAAEQALSVTPSSRLHELRKQSKALRYLVQCTESLADPEAYALVMGALKRLQDELGTIQDTNQISADIRELAPRLAAGSDPAPLLSAGALLDRLRTQQLQARDALAPRVKALGSAKVRRAVHDLFVPGRSGRPS